MRIFGYRPENPFLYCMDERRCAMKKYIQLVVIICMFLCTAYMLMNKQMLFSKVMTAYYTSGSTFTKMNDEHITIHTKEAHVETAYELLAMRSTIHEALETVVPTTNLGDLTVLLIDEDDEAYARYLEDGTIGVYFPMLNTMMLDSSGNANIVHTFVHEYAHYLVDQQLETRVINEEWLPDWFHEGIANYAEYRVLHELPFTYSRFHATPFAQLQEQTIENAHTIYHQGFYTVAHLIHLYGDGIIMNIIDETNTAREFTNGFTRATNIHLATYHKRFSYDETDMAVLYSLVRENPHEAMRQLAKRQEQYARVSPYSEDEFLAKMFMSIAAKDDEAIDALLTQYAFLLDRPSIYVQLAHMLMRHDNALAHELLAQGRALQ